MIIIYLLCFQIENVGYLQTPTTRVGNNIVISAQDPPIVRHTPAPVSQQEYDSYRDISYEGSTMAQYQQYNPVVNNILSLTDCHISTLA